MDIAQQYLPQGLPLSVQVVVATLLLGFVYSYITKEKPFAGYPVISLDGKTPKQSWLSDGRNAIAKGLKETSGPFQIISGTGPKIVLPNRYADEIRSHPSLNFPKAFAPDFFVNYPGFDGHRQGLVDDKLIQDTVRIKLTQSLGLVTDDLVDETIESIRDTFGENSSEWVTRTIREDMVDVVARLSSRVFLGLPLCRNERWLSIAKTYTIDSFVVSYIMRVAPPLLRPIAYWFIPQGKALRQSVRDARTMIEPEVERRIAAVNEARSNGLKPPKVADSLGWMYEVHTRPDTDYVGGQLSLTMAAIHTTTEASCTALLDICEYPEVADELRREIVEVLSEQGFTKTALYKLKLMDSFLKEGQRVRPLGSTSMNRYVEKEIVLSDGTVLPKGARIMVVGNYMDPAVYDRPDEFDAHRFVRMREKPGQENSWQFASTSPSHTLFGHGQHACPGRFFAVNELKIALCHLLLKYDWRFVPEKGRMPTRDMEAVKSIAADTLIQCRKRTPEIDIDNL